MKGIILAGGRGTRLGDCTKSVAKSLLPVYDKPMIYYPITVLQKMGIKDVALVVNDDHYDSFMALLGTGSQFGMKIEQYVQTQPRGLADAFKVCYDFIQEQSVCMVLGDNIMHGHDIDEFCKFARALYFSDMALITSYCVANPSQYGVVRTGPESILRPFGDVRQAIEVIEKPEIPDTKNAVPGLYVFDNKVGDMAHLLQPSLRGELEIADLINLYIKESRVDVVKLSRDTVWFDAGTPDGLLDVSNYVAAYQRRTGKKIGQPLRTLEKVSSGN